MLLPAWWSQTPRNEFASLGVTLYHHQFRGGPGILNGVDRVFGSKFTHDQSQLAVGGHLNRIAGHTVHICGNSGARAIYFHDKFNSGHLFLFQWLRIWPACLSSFLRAALLRCFCRPACLFWYV